jgi:hypothetical protein
LMHTHQADNGDGASGGGGDAAAADDDEWELVDKIGSSGESDALAFAIEGRLSKTLVGVTAADIEAARRKAFEAEGGGGGGGGGGGAAAGSVVDVAPAYEATEGRSPFQPSSVLWRYESKGPDLQAAPPPPYASFGGIGTDASGAGGAHWHPAVLTRDTNLSTLTDAELDEALVSRGVDIATSGEGTPRHIREGLLYPLLPPGLTSIRAAPEPEPSAPPPPVVVVGGGSDGAEADAGDGGGGSAEDGAATSPGASDVDVDDDESPPYEFCCPITQELMRDPVVCADGFTYERAVIVRWLSSNRTSPMTGAVVPHTHVIPNLSLRAIIADAMTRHPKWTTTTTP